MGVGGEGGGEFGWMRWVEENGEDSYGEEKNCGYTIVDIRERQNILVQVVNIA